MRGYRALKMAMSSLVKSSDCASRGGATSAPQTVFLPTGRPRAAHCQSPVAPESRGSAGCGPNPPSLASRNVVADPRLFRARSGDLVEVFLAPAPRWRRTPPLPLGPRPRHDRAVEEEGGGIGRQAAVGGIGGNALEACERIHAQRAGIQPRIAQANDIPRLTCSIE